MPFFSVIIPVYNVEKYLEQCIDSVLNQDYTDFEVILVDDGSTDTCPQICDFYANKYSCIKVIHKKNGGSSSARNAGLDIAVGKYIIFIDSDDFWDSEKALSDLYKEILESYADVVIFRCKDYYEKSGKIKVSMNNYDIQKLRNYPINQCIQYLSTTGLFPGAAWLVTVNRKVLQSFNIRFKDGIVAEDIDWLLNVFLTSSSCSAINSDFYVYRKNRTGSITNMRGEKSVVDILKIIEYWINKIQKDNLDESYKRLLAYYYFTTLIISGQLDKKIYAKFSTRLKACKSILKYSNSQKIKFSNIMVNLFGVRFTGKILNILYQFKLSRSEH